MLSLAQGGQRVEDLADFGDSGSGEFSGDLFGGCGAGLGGEGVTDSADAVGEGGGPRPAGAGGGGRLVSCGGVEAGLGSITRPLEIGAEIADIALALFGGPLRVQGDEAEEDLFGVKVGRPAIGGEDGGVEIVMQLTEDGDESLFVGALFGGGEGRTGAELFEDVVDGGEGKGGMERLLAFAVGVEFLGDGAYPFALGFGGGWKWEGFEAAGFVVPRVVSDAESSARGERPRDVDSAGEDAKNVGIVAGDVDQHVVREDGGVEENEEAVFGGFNGSNIPG